MKVAVDTNVLVRAVVCDDPAQATVAAAVLTDAELIAVALRACANLFGCCCAYMAFSKPTRPARFGRYWPPPTWK